MPPDLMDVAQQRVLDAQDDLMRRRPAAVGREECEECAALISPLRQNLGAQRCIECQQRLEAQLRHMSRRA